MQELKRPAGLDPAVFWPSLIIGGGFVAWGTFAPDSLAAVAGVVLAFIIDGFGWSFVISTAIFLVFAIFLAMSRFGHIKLGHDDDKPEFTTISWVCMMFSVGMGIGLMFWGVAEPISHFGSPPHGLAPPESREAALLAMQYSYFHWALHPWAIYAVTGIVIAYFSYRRDLPVLISSAFTPLLGDAVKRADRQGDRQPRDHRHALRHRDLARPRRPADQQRPELPLGCRESNGVTLTIIAVLSVAFILSAVSGVGKGIQYLQQHQHGAGRRAARLPGGRRPDHLHHEHLPRGARRLPRDLVSMSFRTAAFSDGEWLKNWTIFYWAWWVSWAPFVGVFIARISRGRTIREFVICVLLIPSAVTFVWFTIMGGAALHSELVGQGGLVEAVKEKGAAISLFALLDQYPMASFTCFVACSSSRSSSSRAPTPAPW